MTLPKTVSGFIWYFVRKQWRGFLLLQVMALAWSLDHTVWPYAIKLLIDKVLHYSGSDGNVWYYLMPVLIFWAVVWLAIEVMFRIRDFAIARIFPKLEMAIRMSMFDYVEDHSYTFFADNFAGNISNKISDMVLGATMITQQLNQLYIPALVAFIIGIAMLFHLSVIVGVIFLIWTLLHGGICYVASGYLTRYATIHSTSRSFLTGKIVDSFTNIINVKLFAKRQYEYAYISRYQQDERAKNQSALKAMAIVKVALGVSSLVFPGALITWAQIYAWHRGLISVADLVLVINLNMNLTMLAWYAGLELPNFFRQVGICQQALSIIRSEHDIVNKPNAKPLVIKQGDIAYEQVDFHYAKQNTVFKQLSLKIPAGHKIGLVGYSGAGKSTFVNLLMRFFDIQAGRILIDGQDISGVTVDSLRGQISMIPQDPTLFHRNLRDNIAYGNPDATESMIIEAAKQAFCHDFIMNLPEGYETLVGERGIKLSGGQRQRVAIARAILEDAPILVLDEATSALDSVTEQKIQQGLSYLMQDRTTIVIAHRLSTLAQMDQILVFDQGQIIETGDHDALLRQQGHYAAMWHMQAGGFLPEQPMTKDE